MLFLADRTALVNQAANAFKAHLPDATTVNLVTEKVSDGRVYVCTYPTMMNLINDTDSGIRTFGPGYFDLVVIDEAHRSVYQKYGAIFAWFDSLLVGLTATPKDEVDHNTYRLFHLEDGVPTDAYSLDDAVNEGFLVPAVGVSVGDEVPAAGHPVRRPVRGGEGRVGCAGMGRGRRHPGLGVLRGDQPVPVQRGHRRSGARHADGQGAQGRGGDRLGKTIIFAKNQRPRRVHPAALRHPIPRIRRAFRPGHHPQLSYAQSLIDDFSTTDKAPHIAISVDMLDTGIDVPEVVNLVFFKLVRSKTKFWQMIGRGTRLRPDLFGPGQTRQNFYVFDFCGNLEFFSQDLPGSEGSLQKSLNQRLFETRLGLDHRAGRPRQARRQTKLPRDRAWKPSAGCGGTPHGSCTPPSPG